MKKILIIFLLFFFFHPLIAEKEYDIGEKKVIGEDKREYKDELKIIKSTNKKKKLIKDTQIKIREEKIDVFEEDEIKIVETDDTLKSLIPGEDSKGIENQIIFGLGGYKRIDAFKYLIDYKKEDRKKNFSYFLHVDRYIRGNDRKNSDMDSDNYMGKIWYKNIYLGLSHTIKDENFPGRTDALLQVNSFKKEKISELNFKSKLFSNKKSSLQIGSDIYSKKLSSLSTLQRQYKNNLYNFFTSYDNFFNMGNLKNFMQIEIGYYRDNMPDDKISCINMGIESKMKLSSNKTISFDIKLGTEFIDRNKEEKENNFIVYIGANKYLNKNFRLGLNFEKENLNKVSKNIFNGFEFDDDILPFHHIKPDNNIKGEFTANFDKKNIYLETKLRHIRSKDKIIYKEDYSLNNEVVIKVLNNTRTISWQEAEFKASYTYSILRGEIKYIYNNLKKIPFTPVNKFIMILIFKYKKIENKLEGKYYTTMYGDMEGINRIKEYENFNLYNNYRFNQNLLISLNIFNLLNSGTMKKTKYPIDLRKIMLEFKINY